MGREYANGPIRLALTASTVDFSTDSINFPFGVEVQDNGSGSLYAQGQSIVNNAPTAVVATRALNAIYDNISLTGTCIDTNNGPIEAFIAYLRNLLNCQSGAASNHSYSVVYGLLRLGTLSAARGQDASQTILLDALTDPTGANAPVTGVAGVTIPATPINTRFSLGLVTVAGVDYEEIDSVELDFGVTTTTKRPRLGKIWPQSIGVLQVRPRLTLTGRDVSHLVSALLAVGAETAAHANTKIRLKRRASPGAFVADGTTQHITITLAGLHVPDDLASASGTAEATTTATLQAHFDGSNAPVVFNTASAYSEA